MNLRLFIVAAIGVLLGALLALAIVPSQTDGLPPGPRQVTTGKALIGGPFTLTDHRGQTVTDKDFRGRYMLVYFGFTYCPSICPTGLQVIAGALDKLGKKGDRVTPLFITVDPERDTPAKLAEYVKSFHPRLVGLTGTAQQIKAAAHSYRIYYAKVKNSELPDDYTIDHSAFFYFMDRKGALIKHFRHSIDVDELTERLAKEM